MKTPLTNYLEIHGYRLDSKFCKFWLQKEKAFAFDCYQEGYSRSAWEECGYSDEDKPMEFEEFYSQYVPQHNK